MLRGGGGSGGPCVGAKLPTDGKPCGDLSPRQAGTPGQLVAPRHWPQRSRHGRRRSVFNRGTHTFLSITDAHRGNHQGAPHTPPSLRHPSPLQGPPPIWFPRGPRWTEQRAFPSASPWGWGPRSYGQQGPARCRAPDRLKPRPPTVGSPQPHYPRGLVHPLPAGHKVLSGRGFLFFQSWGKVSLVGSQLG